MRDPRRTALAAALALWLGVIWAGAPRPAAARAAETAKPAAASETVTKLANWVIASGDNSGLPFVIVDKVAAEVFVFRADGRLRGAAPALLGFAKGDRSAPGIGDRQLSTIRPRERTTPAGRFLAGFGPAKGDGKVLWVDYATAISLHAVVTANPKEHRLERLRSPTPKDNRITYGCINVSAGFYEDVVRRTFTGTSGVVYILPETKPLDEVFPAFRVQARASTVPTGDPDAGVVERPGEASEADNRRAPPAVQTGGSEELLQTAGAESRPEPAGP